MFHHWRLAPTWQNVCISVIRITKSKVFKISILEQYLQLILTPHHDRHSNLKSGTTLGINLLTWDCKEGKGELAQEHWALVMWADSMWMFFTATANQCIESLNFLFDTARHSVLPEFSFLYKAYIIMNIIKDPLYWCPASDLLNSSRNTTYNLKSYTIKPILSVNYGNDCSLLHYFTTGM